MSLNSTIDSAPGTAERQWVQFLPAGPIIKGRDGRQWRCVDPHILVAAFNANNGPLAIDYEHAIDTAPKGKAVPAAGWIEAMEVRNGELWGLVDWTEKARAAIDAREYRFERPKSHALDVAMKTTSSTKEEVYAWLGQFPQLREWLGDRVINNIVASDFKIKNRKFESTIVVPRDEIADDQYGIYAPMFENMGRTTALHPDTLVFSLLRDGFSSPCYDGQSFFDTDHPVGAPGFEVPVSNMQDGSGPAWFLLDTSQPFKPLIWQEREPYKFQMLNKEGDQNVVMRDEYLYGIRARVNAGYGFWQLAFGSKADLTADNYADARSRMQVLKGDQGGLLGVIPTVLVVPPALEKVARKLLKATSGTETVTVGETTQVVPFDNIWHESADLIVTPFIV